MRHPSRRAFTLVELLIVLTVIALLLAVLVPFVSKVFVIFRKVQCADNLRHINVAYHTRQSGEGAGPLNVWNWQIELAAYLGSEIQVYRCPEDPDPNAGPAKPPPSLEVEVWTHAGFREVPPDSHAWNMVCEEGEWARKKNVTENSYELWMEDKWNDTWNDLILRFTDLGRGRTEIKYVDNHTGSNWYHLIDVSTGEILIEQMGWPHGRDQKGRTVIIETCDRNACYGMNSLAGGDRSMGSVSGVVLALDYEIIVARGPTDDLPDDWRDFLGEDLKLTFARHFGKCNVVYADGAVVLVDPETLDPANPAFVVEKLWDPLVAGAR